MSEQDLYQQDLFPLPRPSSPRELKKRFPYQFNGPHIGYSFTIGWFLIFAQLSIDIDRVLDPTSMGFTWCGKDAKPYVSPSHHMLQMCEEHGVPFSTQGGAPPPQFWISEESDLGAQA